MLDPKRKTASHLERLILSELRRHAICSGVTAVTVRETADGKSWEIADIYTPGGGGVLVPCREVCLAAAVALREQFDLLPETELVPDDDLRLR